MYVVSLSNSLDKYDGRLSEAPLAEPEFDRWLRVRRDLRLDRSQPTAQQLMDRVRHFWIPDEVILYIGCATSLFKRLGQYYQTPIGARGPHSGGYFVKLLSNLDQLWVHYAECSDPRHAKDAEDGMLRRFCENVSEDSKLDVRDPGHPFPFANLEWPQGVRKAHGLSGAREPRRKANPSSRAASKTTSSRRSSAIQDDAPYATLRVTSADLRGGRIRIPSRTDSLARTLFSPREAAIGVRLRGRLLQEASWDPRTGSDRQRSGVLRVSRSLRDLVREGETLVVSITEDGVISVD